MSSSYANPARLQSSNYFDPNFDIDNHVLHPEECLSASGTRLTVSTNKLLEFEMKNIGDFLNDHPKVKSVCFSTCKIVDSELRIFCDFLTHNTTVKTLDLTCNQFTHLGASYLGAALSVNSTLSKLRMGLNYIGNEGAAEIVRGLATNSSLTQLELPFCSIGASGGEVIRNFLAHHTTLTSIDLHDCGSPTTHSEVPSFGSILATNSTITSINLGGDILSSDDIVSISKALATNQTLRSIDLSSQYTDSRALISIADGLRRNTVLTALDVGSGLGRSILPEGIESLTHVLKSTTSLRSLGLSDTLSGVCAGNVASLLLVNTSIVSLTIFPDNQDDSLDQFAVALTSTTSLRCLHFRHAIGEFMTTKQTDVIAQAMLNNGSIVSLEWKSLNSAADEIVEGVLTRNRINVPAKLLTLFDRLWRVYRNNLQIDDLNNN